MVIMRILLFPKKSNWLDVRIKYNIGTCSLFWWKWCKKHAISLKDVKCQHFSSVSVLNFFTALPIQFLEKIESRQKNSFKTHFHTLNRKYIKYIKYLYSHYPRISLKIWFLSREMTKMKAKFVPPIIKYLMNYVYGD